MSSEGGGNKGINCNRETATGGWEQFTLKSTSGKFIDEVNGRVKNKKTNLITVYPNPTANSLKFNGINHSESYTVTIFKLLGSSVLSQITKITSIDVSNLGAGNYIIKIIDLMGEEYTDTFIKK